MNQEIMPIIKSDTNAEVMARITKVTAQKYNCDVEIDFSSGARKAVFMGPEEMKAPIIGEVLDNFKS